MTKDEINKKIRADFFGKRDTEDEYEEWTDEELLATAKVIAKRLGLTEKFITEDDRIKCD